MSNKTTNVNISSSGGAINIGGDANVGGFIEHTVQSGGGPADDTEVRTARIIEPFDVFLSYSQHDREIVDRIAEALQNIGLSVWYDRQIDPSSSFLIEINKRLHVARVVIVVWSRHSCQSEWVLNEAEIARGRNVLLGVRIDESNPPAPFALRQAPRLEIEAEGGSVLPRDVQASIKALMAS